MWTSKGVEEKLMRVAKHGEEMMEQVKRQKVASTERHAAPPAERMLPDTTPLRVPHKSQKRGRSSKRGAESGESSVSPAKKAKKKGKAKKHGKQSRFAAFKGASGRGMRQGRRK